MSEQKPWSWRRDVARGALIVFFVLLTVGVVSLPVGFVDGLTFRISQDRLIQVRTAFPVLRLECEKEVGRSKWISYDNPGVSIPLVFRFRRCVVRYKSSETTVPTQATTVPAGPPVNGWQLRFHVWPFAALTIAYPAFVLFRFLRPFRPRSIARRIIPFCLVSLFTSAAIVSLLLCLGVCIVWVRSHWVPDTSLSTCARHADGRTIWRTYFYASHRGMMGLGRLVSIHPASLHPSSPPSAADHYDLPLIEKRFKTVIAKPRDTWYRELGFDFASGESASNPPYSHWWIGLPCWLLVLVSTVLPIAWIRGFRRRLISKRRLSVGWCHKCGYDLRGNVSGICPECGEKIEPCVP